MNKSLGDAIYEACDGVGLDEMSVTLGLSPNQLHRWAAGSEPTPRYYEKLQGFLRVTRPELGALIIETQWRKFSGLPLVAAKG